MSRWALAVTKLERSPALLVLDGGRPRAVVSSTDVLSYLSSISGDALTDGVGL